MPQYPAQKRYKAKAIKRVILDLNRNTDADILQHLETQPNKSAYLKRLIREDIERGN